VCHRLEQVIVNVASNAIGIVYRTVLYAPLYNDSLPRATEYIYIYGAWCSLPSFSTSFPSPPSPPSPPCPFSPSPPPLNNSSRCFHLVSCASPQSFPSLISPRRSPAAGLQAGLCSRTPRRPDDALIRSRPTRGQHGPQNTLHPAAQEPAERSVPLRAQSLVVTGWPQSEHRGQRNSMLRFPCPHYTIMRWAALINGILP